MKILRAIAVLVAVGLLGGAVLSAFAAGPDGGVSRRNTNHFLNATKAAPLPLPRESEPEPQAQQPQQASPAQAQQAPVRKPKDAGP